MIIPVGAAQKRFHLAGLRVDGNQLQGPPFGERTNTTLLLVLSGRRRRRLAGFKIRQKLFIDEPRQQGLVGIN